MGGFLIPSTTIGGSVNAPGIPFHDSPEGGLYETSTGGFGFSISGETFFELENDSFRIGYKPAEPFGISAIQGSPFGSGAGPRILAVSPNGAFAFVVNSGANSLSAYQINTNNGVLTPVDGSPFAVGVNPYGVVVSPDGAHVIVTNENDNNISVFSLNPITGALAAIVGSPFAANGTPAGVSVSPNGNFIFVCDSSNHSVSAYQRNSVTGSLTPVAGSPFATGNGPLCAVVSSDGLHLFVANSNDSTLSIFSINSATGALTQIPNSPFATGSQPYSIAVSPSSDFIFTANLGGNTVSAFSFNPLTEAVNIVAGSPFATGTNPISLGISPDGNHLFVSNDAGNSLSVFSISVTGALAQIAGSPFAIGNSPYGLAVSPSGSFVYVANNADATISGFQTTTLLTFNLIQGNFDPRGLLSGSVLVNGSLLIAGQQTLSQALADKRYAALAGLITQPFSAKTLTLDHAAGGLEGTPTNDNAIAGVVGEYIADVVATPGVALATGVVSNVGSIALTAGDWDVDGVVDFVPAATTSLTQLTGGISAATGALGGQDTFVQDSMAAEVPGANNIVMRTPTVRISIAANTTIYLVASGVFSVSTLSAFGTIRARRVR